MAQFAEITLTSTNLTGGTNFFTVDMKECSSPTFTTIQTGLTYSDFPYLVNLDENFGVINCYDYKVSESITNLVCSGQTNITGVTTTPTPSITPSVTATPTITPSITITPTVTVTSTPSSTPPTCNTYSILTGQSINDVCISAATPINSFSTSEFLFNGTVLGTDNCVEYGGSEMPENTFLKISTGSTVFVTLTGGTISQVGICASPTPTPTPSITPSISVTPSLTPSVTPTPSYTGVTVEFGTSYESGSTIANYSFTASTSVSQNTTIDFTNILSLTNNSPVLIASAVTINAGQTIGTATARNSSDYNNIRGYQTSFTGITSTGDLVGKTDNTKSVDFVAKNSPVYQNQIFRACCSDSSPQTINVQVDGDAVASGGWVDSGQGVILYGNCYTPYSAGGDGSDGIMYGPDFKACNFSDCLCPSVTPTPTPTITPTPTPSSVSFNNYKLISCCDGSLLYVNLSNQTSIVVGDIISYSSECWTIGAIEPADDAEVSISGSFDSCGDCLLVNTCPTPTPTPTPSECAYGLDCVVEASEECELSCYTNLVSHQAKRAVNCCDGTTTSLMIPPSLEEGDVIFWNDDCWLIDVNTSINENYVVEYTGYTVCEECIGCNGLLDCTVDWITGKVDPCCDGDPQLTQGAITLSGTACVGDGVIVDGTCYTITSITDGQAGGALVVTQSDIVDDICNNPSCTGCLVSLRSCAVNNNLADVNYFPNYMNVYSGILPNTINVGDILTLRTTVTTGVGHISGNELDLDIDVCYTVVADDESYTLNTDFTYIATAGSCTSDKCEAVFVALKQCGVSTQNGSNIIVGVSNIPVWADATVGDFVQSPWIASNQYTSNGYFLLDNATCFEILPPGSDISQPQEFPGGGTYTTNQTISTTTCVDSDCEPCISGITVTNEYELMQPITIQYYTCETGYTQLNVPYNTSVVLSGCVNIISLIQLNYNHVLNDNILINYNLNNTCN